MRKKIPKGVQKGDRISGVAALGAPWTAFDAPICFWTQKVYPKCLKNDLQGAKVTTKCFKSNPQGRKMHSYRSAKVVQVHQKMSAARYQARRTVRSAYNKLVRVPPRTNELPSPGMWVEVGGDSLTITKDFK